MPETKTQQTYAAQSSAIHNVRLEPTRLPALDKVTPEQYARLSPKQQAELVGRLIDFLKTF